GAPPGARARSVSRPEPGAAPAEDEWGSAPGAPASAAGPPGGLDAAVADKVDAIQGDWAPGQLEQHLRTLALCLVHGHAGAVAADACRGKLNARLKQVGLSSVSTATWKQLLKEAADTAAFPQGAGGEAAPGAGTHTHVLAQLPAAPVPPDVVVPPGWKLTPSGVVQARAGQDALVLPTPLLITDRLANEQDQTELLGLTWWRD